MSAFQIQGPDYEARVRQRFAGQMALATLRVTLTRIEPATLELQMPYDVKFSQQNGFLHGGVMRRQG